MPGIVDITGPWDGPPLMGAGEGKAYTKHEGYICGLLSFSLEGEGGYREKYRGIGCGLMPFSFPGWGEGRTIPHSRGCMSGVAMFFFFGQGEGRMIPPDVRGRGCGTLSLPYGKGEGLTYNPREGSCDLEPLIRYMSVYLPELDGALPSPLPPQEKVSLHVLYSKEWSLHEKGDRNNWYLLGMNYEGRPAALFRRAPASHFPMRTIVDKTNFMRAISYLGRLWEVDPAPPLGIDRRLTQEELDEVRRPIWGPT